MTKLAEILLELKRLSERATPGPWFFESHSSDCELVAFARNCIPELVRQVDTLKSALEYCAHPEGKHTDQLFELASDCGDGDYYRETIKKARAALRDCGFGEGE